MPRARNIKPSFFTNEEIAEVDPFGRLLFIALWTIADREGRVEDRPKRIAVQALPFDRNVDVDALLDDLQRAGFIVRYEAEGVRVIEILNFARHQRPHPKEPPSELPPRPETPEPEQNAEKNFSPGKETASCSLSLPSFPSYPSPSPIPLPCELSLAARVTPAELSRAMREGGVQAQPADPRLIALSERGVSAETVHAACAAAREAKPGERIPPGYVVKIIENWQQQAGQMKANGSTGPPRRASPHAARTAKFAGRLGEKSEPKQDEVVDVDTRRVG